MSKTYIYYNFFPCSFSSSPFMIANSSVQVRIWSAKVVIVSKLCVTVPKHTVFRFRNVMIKKMKCGLKNKAMVHMENGWPSE